MVKINSMSVSGVSRIDDRDVAYFSATVDEPLRNYVVTKSVADRAAYAAHKAECDEDFAQFEASVMALSPTETE